MSLQCDARHGATVDMFVPSLDELLDAWRDATRAAELAERLATVALEAAQHADRTALTSEEIVTLADAAASAAERAAVTAREAATRARHDATAFLRLDTEAADRAAAARAVAAEARDRYEDGERRRGMRDGGATRIAGG
jgi:hypothetical protein